MPVWRLLPNPPNHDFWINFLVKTRFNALVKSIKMEKGVGISEAPTKIVWSISQFTIRRFRNFSSDEPTA